MPSRRRPAGLKLLGRGLAAIPAEPSADILETFPNRTPGRDYWVTFETSEFTSLCPVTGQADFATVRIRYIPGNRCIESKSLKFYLASYRNVRSFNEEVANRMLDDLVAACAPRRMEIRAEFAARGGIALAVEICHPQR